MILNRTDTYVYRDRYGRKVFQRIRWEKPDGDKLVTYEHGAGIEWLHGLDDTGYMVEHGRLASPGSREVIFKGKPSLCPFCRDAESAGAGLADTLLYRLPEMLEVFDDADVIYWTEGESDSNAIIERRETSSAGDGDDDDSWMGWATVSHHQGASVGANIDQARWFEGYQGIICLISDNDDAGAYDVLRRRELLLAVGVPERQIILYQPAEGYKDVREQLEDGVTLLHLVPSDLADLEARAERFRAAGKVYGQSSGDSEPLGEWKWIREGERAAGKRDGASAEEEQTADEGGVDGESAVGSGEYTLDDVGNAARLIDAYGDELRYVRDIGHWAVWEKSREGGIWVVDDAAAERRWIKVTEEMLKEQRKLLRQMKKGLLKESEEKQAKAFFGHVARSRNTGGRAGALAATAVQPGMSVMGDRFDANPRLFKCLNGTVELRDSGALELRESARDDLVTLSCGVAYEEGAWAGWDAGSEWARFLGRLLPDAEVRDWVQRLVGYSLLGANPERKVVCVLGPTSSGKTTFAEILQTVIGSYAGAMSGTVFRDNQDERPRSDIIKVLNKRFVVSEEMSGSWHLHADQIKRLAGGGRVIARVPYAPEPIERLPAFTPWFIANDPPTIKDADLALWRRVVVVPFDVSLDESEVDMHLKDRLLGSDAVRREILCWALKGWTRYCESGLALPRAVLETNAKFREDVSDFDRWLRDCCERDAEYREQPAMLYDSYSDWCEINNIPPRDRASSILFGKRLSGLGIGSALAREGGKVVRYRVGLRLKPRKGTASV